MHMQTWLPEGSHRSDAYERIKKKNTAMADCTLFPRTPGKEVVVEIMNQRNNAFPISKGQKKSASVENRRRLCFVYFVGRGFPGRLQLVSECELQNTALAAFTALCSKTKSRRLCPGTEFYRCRKTTFVLLLDAHVDANRNGRF